jgi:hypothetical protein
MAVKENIAAALSQLTNDFKDRIDANYVHKDNNYTDDEKPALAGLNNNDFKDSYPTLHALERIYPTAGDGDYAYVGVVGIPAVIFIEDLTDSN